MPDWDENSPTLIENCKRTLKALRDEARRRNPVNRDLARTWHVSVMQGLDADDPAWVGIYRGESAAADIHVAVGPNRGSPPEQVAGELEAFFDRLNRVLVALDEVIDESGSHIEDERRAILDLCGWVHAEWVRIHPFVNGNGRTARFWANFIAMRYGLPPFVRLRPSPNSFDYGLASEAAMKGHWQPTAAWMHRMLADFLN